MIGGLVAIDARQDVAIPSWAPAVAPYLVTGHQRQVDHQPDVGGGTRRRWARWPPTPRAPTWTPGWLRRWQAHAKLSWPRSRSTRCILPHVADADESASRWLLLNLSRDQLDRVGEMIIERTPRGQWLRHPDAVVVAECDDAPMTSAAYDCPRCGVGGRGGRWANDSVSCPRSG